MTALIEVVDSGDLCSLGMAVLVLLFAGHFVVRGHERLAAGIASVVFLGYAVYRLGTTPPGDAEEVLDLALRCLVAAGLALGACWLAVPVLAVVWSRILGVLEHGLTHGLLGPWSTMSRWWRERNERYRQRVQAQADEKAAAQREQDAQTRAAEARRREEARAACVLAYLAQPGAQARFSRQELDAYLERYLGEDQPPDRVEQRAEQLKELLRPSAGQTSAPESGLERLTRWRQQMEEQIHTLVADSEARTLALALLAERYDRRLITLLEEMEP